MAKPHCQKLNMKRKVFAKGKKQNFKRFKRTPKYVKNNPENQIAREKENDPFLFTDSEDEPDNDLGMGLELSDLPSILDDNLKTEDLVALTQDSVRPLFSDTSPYDESKLDQGLAELQHTSFRPNQKETIKRILFGRSTIFISSTGSGKSLCYQLPALLYWRYRRYITVVVSPLISLMEDQINSLPKALQAVSLNSNLNYTQKRLALSQLINGEAQIVFVSPEAIVGGLLDLADIRSLPPVGFVCVDEAHCLSEWSHNFRPAYMQFIALLKEKVNVKTFLGLTATATKKTIFGIARSLTINPEYDVIGSTTIPSNLVLSVSVEVNKELALIDLLKLPTFMVMPSIIIYCNRRDDTERVASLVRTAMQQYTSKMREFDPSLPWNAEAYHAGLSSESRKRIHRRFIKGELRIIAATVAFGMGINKSNIRAVIHYDMPGSFESYVQEIGRAGRDGKVAQCHMFLKADKTDVFYQQRNIYSSHTERKNLVKLVEYLFVPCLHIKTSDLKDQEKVNKLNNLDPAESVIKKHRLCTGHEIAFSIEEATREMNLWPELIMTLLCQIQQAYPQLLLKQFPTCKPNFTLSCKSPEQLKGLEVKSRPVKTALFLERKNNQPCGSSRKLNCDAVKVASVIGESSEEVIKSLYRLKWELSEKSGRFHRSDVRVTNSNKGYFHVLAVGDLDQEETKAIEAFVINSVHRYESKERTRILNVYETFKSHCITLDKMLEKNSRLVMSDRIKTALITYFDKEDSNQLGNDVIGSISGAKDLEIRASARAFASAHGKEGYSPQIMAKIFQGISTPNHPAEHWGPNRKWWRKHIDVDFKILIKTITDELY